MIGKLEPRSKDVTLVGAGISGLLAAYYLDRAGYRVSLLEASSRAGGLISTSVTPHGLVEEAAHSFPGTETLSELCNDLGVELAPLKREGRARWIFRRGKPRRFPLKPWEALGMFSRAYFKLAPSRDPESLTLEEWARQFLGEKALRFLVTPFVRGVYGASAAELSVAAAFPALCVPRGHSLVSFFIAGKWRSNPPSGTQRVLHRFPRGQIAAPREGMQALTRALGQRLEERLGPRFQKSHQQENLAGLVTGDNLILCVPAHEAGRLLESESPELASMLKDVSYSRLTTATIFVEERALANPPRGIGVLIPEAEGPRCLGILYNSAAFPGRVSREGLVSLTMMFDGSAPEPGSPELRKKILADLKTILGFEPGFLEIHAKRWERAIPKYDAHLLRTWECAERSWCARPGRVLFGNYTGQVSIRGMAELAKRLAAS